MRPRRESRRDRKGFEKLERRKKGEFNPDKAITFSDKIAERKWRVENFKPWETGVARLGERQREEK